MLPGAAVPRRAPRAWGIEFLAIAGAWSLFTPVVNELGSRLLASSYIVSDIAGFFSGFQLPVLPVRDLRRTDRIARRMEMARALQRPISADVPSLSAARAFSKSPSAK